MKYRVFFITCAISFAIAFSGLCVGIYSAVAAPAVSRGVQLFEAEDGSRIKITGDQAISALANVTLHDETKGVLLSTTQEKAAFRFTQEMSGAFDLEFRVTSTQTGVNDMSFLHITFTDSETGRHFTIYFNRQGMVGGWGYTSVIPDDGTDMDGHAFVKDASVAGEDGVHRSDLEWDYHALYHTASFCNTAEGAYTEPASVRFDPATMEVSALTQGEWYCMMDLDRPEHIAAAGCKGGVFTGFQRYTVKVVMSGLKEPGSSASPGNLYVYTVNGQKTDGIRMTNTAGPRLSAKAKQKAVAGYPVTLAAPSAYDVIDGYLQVAGEPEITSPDGGTVTVVNGAFTPEKDGVYTVTYRGAGVEDSGGLTAKDVSYALTVLKTRPAAEISVSDFSDMEIAPGTALSLPKADFANHLALTDGQKLPVALTVTKEGAAEPVFFRENADEPVEFTFEEEGEYLVNYSATDAVGVTTQKNYRITVSGAVPVFSVPEFSRTVSRNTEFIVPKATASAAGKDYPVSHVVVLPDGSENRDDAIALRQVGRCTIYYSCEKDGKLYTWQELFEVITPPASLFENVRGCTVEQNVTSPAWAGDWDDKTPYNGVKITTTGNSASVRFVNPIDVSRNTSRDTLFEFIVLPDEVGKYEIANLVFTLTDAHDPANYITVQVSQCGARDLEYASLAKAAARGDTPKGHNGRNGTLVTTAPYGGANMTTSFYGYPIDRNGTKDKLAHAGKIFYDAVTQKLWVDFRGEQNLILDLDDPQDVGVGNEWGGFTTGEVYVTIAATEPAASNGHFMMLNINGLNLAGERVASDRPPTFRVDYAGNSLVPEGQAGKKYPVFKAIATDVVNGELPLRTEVYRDYGTDGQRAYPVDDDACFLPDQAGVYTIVYLTDAAFHTVAVTVRERLEALTYAFTGSYETAGQVGCRSVILPGEVSGGSGDHKDVAVTVTRLQDDSPLEVRNGIFLPLRQGNYRVRVVARDYLGSEAVAEYELRVTYKTEPVMIAEPSLPKAIQKGKPFLFPELVAVDYFTNKQLPQDVYGKITVNGVALDSDRVYIPSEAGVLTVVYRAEAPFDAEHYLEKTYAVKVLDIPEESYKSEYFYLDPSGDFSVADTPEYAEFSTLQEGAYIEFANLLMADGFNFNFQVPDVLADFDYMNLTLTDAENALISVVLGIYPETTADGKASYLAVNGKRTGLLAGVLGDANAPFELTYDNDAHTVKNRSGVTVGTVAYTSRGEAFQGFLSGKIILNLSFHGVRGGAGIQIRSINGQAFNQYKTDNVAPGILLYGALPKTAEIGSEIEIPYAFGSDVLDAVSTLTVTVLAPNGQKIVSDAPVTRGMTFRAEHYGRYSVSYQASDSRGNKNSLRLTMLVNDLIPPEIALDGAVPSEGKIGKELSLPGGTVTDNNDTDLKLYLFVLNPDGAIDPVNGNAFTPERAGVYYVIYYAMDSGSSYVYRSYAVRVA